MSRHWRFALSKANLNDSIICILGDDDVISPDALQIARRAFEHLDIKAILRRTGYYFTPDCASKHAGWLYCPRIDGKIEVRNSSEVIKMIAAGKLHYGELPSIYHGFFKGSLISEALKRGDLFDLASPDISCAIALAIFGHKYATINYPLTLGVASPASNGLNTTIGSEIGEEFFRSSLRDIHHNYFARSVSLQVLDAIVRYSKSLEKDIEIDYMKFYNAALADIRQSDIHNAMESLSQISGRSKQRIFLDYSTAQMKLNFKALTKRAIGSNNIIAARKIFDPKNHRDSFSFSGPASKLGQIDSPIDCLNLIRRNVGEVKW